jgi:putative pyruvate formate lyase activating enzyme
VEPALISRWSVAEKARRLEERLPELWSLLEPCRLCPRCCLTERRRGKLGECGIGDTALVSSAGLHHGEEPPISGWRGSGTIFLTGCNLHCLFCQNWTISQAREGEPFSIEDLAHTMIALEKAGAHNINWVSPTHVLPILMEALLLAWRMGLSLPVVYNSGGYDSLDALRLLDGLIDVYMPDMKYSDAATAERLSGAKDYPSHNQAALREMYRQVGPLECDSSGVAVRGLLIRHLVLPDDLAGSEAAFDFLARELPGPVDVNVMAQYHPCHQAAQHPALARRLPAAEYQAAVRAAQARPSIRLVR